MVQYWTVETPSAVPQFGTAPLLRRKVGASANFKLGELSHPVMEIEP